MKILGYEILKADSFAKTTEKITALEDAYYSNRPSIDQMGQINTGGVNIPFWPIKPRELEDMAKYSDIILLCLLNLKREAFRKGIELKQNNNVNHLEEATENTILKSEVDLFNKFKDRANDNDQTLLEVFGELENDINIFDDSYLFFNRDYGYNTEGEIVQKKLKELLRMNPGFTKIISDRSGNRGFDDSGDKVYVCPNHRSEMQKTIYCSVCNKENLRAHYRYDLGKEGMNQSYVYYGEGEIMHASKYTPSLLYGFSPLLSLWQKVITLMNQDKYIREYYGLQRPPKGALFVNTRNQDSLKKAWEWLLQKTRSNPHIIHPLGVETNGSGSTATFINFMNNLNEMQYTAGRDEMRRIMGAVYGVSPIFQNDVSTSGGLNNEGLQITVTNRAVEGSQKVYNNKFLPGIKRELGITTFTPQLIANDEADKMSNLQRQAQELANARAMVDMGVPLVVNEDGSFSIKKGFSGVLEVSSVSPPNDSFGPANPFLKSDVSKAENLIEKPARTLSDKYEEIISSRLNKIIDPKLLKKEDLILVSSLLSKEIVGDIKNNNNEYFKKIYNQSLESVSNELSLDIGFEPVDNDSLKEILNSDTLNSAYKDLGDGISETLNENIGDAIDRYGFDIPKIKEVVMETAKVNASRASTIARTETNKVSNAARNNAYKKVDPDDSGNYDWIGPSDNRTTQLSKNIQSRVGDGVSREELVKIISEESKKFFPEWVVNPDAPVSHYNSRHLMRYRGK